ncbi:AMP-binding protein [Rhodococcus spelaei]|uniref:AMP-binding protein n=1 Tax=Rhodococcus spelaei TaxID=2546320 RepID=A0A541AZI8_9NOCA|nr:AMP-binding protein [Rhodococcus spelaei]TQF65487.1 AMP-binding protein [Rhodococcus spelaei]
MSWYPEVLNGSVRRVVATAQNGLEVVRLGGLETEARPSEFRVVERKPMYRLRRYFSDAAADTSRPPVVLVPPMMMSADVYDVAQDQGAVGVLHGMGLDPWVVDFGSPATEDGGWRRTLADHIVAIDEIVDLVHAQTGRDVHLAGYSQGGMFAYQAAAYRRCKNIATLITFGAPVDTLAALPFGIPAGVATRTADFLADHVFNRLAVTGWMARTGFQLLDPVKTAKSRLDFLRQLHDREALLPREQQRRFLATDGWVAWSGPAVADVLKQFIAHNRMMSGGFVIGDRLVSLAELTCPILAFVGEVDDIGQPVAVRGIRKAAPKAEIFETTLRAGHFGLVVGSLAASQTWPITGEWVRWRDGLGPRPESIDEMTYEEQPATETGVSVSDRLLHTGASIAEVGVGVTKGVFDVTTQAVRGSRELSAEAVRALPRLVRLGQIQPHTTISLGKLLAEAGAKSPKAECFLFDDRAYTNDAVNTRIDNVVKGLISTGVRPAARVGVLMETRPSALTAIAALSRIGAVVVLIPPTGDMDTAARLGKAEMVITDPDNLRAAESLDLKVLVLGGGESRVLDIEPGSETIDLEQIDPSRVHLPAWYRPNPGRANELAFVLFGRFGGHVEAKHVTNHRWALSAFGTATAANLGRGDTVYSVAPLYHSSVLLATLGGAIAGGSRIALSRGLDPERFATEVHRYGVTVVAYTWTMLRELVDSPDFALDASHPIRLFVGSGMPRGLWLRTMKRFEPAQVLEFYASTEGAVVLANVSGAKPGAKGRPLPGSTSVRIAAYDPISGTFLEDERGLVRECGVDEVGLLLGQATGSEAISGAVRGVFGAGDAWVPTEHLFRRDGDGDFWLMDDKNVVVRALRGPVYGQPIVDALGGLDQVDLAVVYGVLAGDEELAVAAITLRPGSSLTAVDLADSFADLAPGARPDLVHVVPEIPISNSYRPRRSELVAAGLPAPSVRSWFYDPDKDGYRRLTRAVLTELRERGSRALTS